VSSQSFGVSLSNYYERKQKGDPTVNISSHRSFNWAFYVQDCYSSVQTAAINQPLELVCSQMASLYDSVIEFLCQLEILN
jgi:hypothetical protein